MPANRLAFNSREGNAANAGKPSFDAAAERTALSDLLANAVSRLETEADAGELLRSFTDLLADASPRIALGWLFIGRPQDPEIRPHYLAGELSDYARDLVVDRSRIMLRGPVRSALDSGQAIIRDIPARLTPAQWLIPGVRRWHRRAMEANVRSVLAMPFSLQDGDQWGLVVVYSTTYGYFDAVGLEPFAAIGRLVQVGLDRIALRDAEAQSRVSLERMRSHDTVTGLPRLEAWWSELCRRDDRDPCGWTVVQLDIDDFTMINTLGGRELGDEVLARVAERLRTFSGESGLVGHVGGDEFVLAVPAPGNAADTLGERCLDALAEPLRAGGHDLILSATVGVSMLDRLDDAGFRRLGRELALAQEEAHGIGAGAVRVFRGGLERTGGAMPQGMVAAVKQALGSGAFELWYQPQVTLGDAAPGLGGVEALVRWNDPQRGMILPGDFIPAVENSLLIREVGKWVVETALAALDEWGDTGPPRVGVNIGARHLLHREFSDDIARALAKYPDVEPRRLSVEITETAALHDLDAAVAAINRLRAMGIAVALDDFGTGYASLSHLQSMPLDYLKLDRSLVRGIDTDERRQAIARGLMIAASGLGMGVVAEGVETAAEASVLAAFDCPLAQGYLFAKPMPQADLEVWAPSPIR